MMRAFRIFALTAAMTAFASTASAVDFAANAVVTIVEGITISENTQMNFGTLALNTGDVVLATDGTTTDATNLISDATGIAAASFDVTSVTDAVLNVTITPDAVANGLVLSAPTFDWGGGTATANPVTSTGTDILLVGATLSVDKAAASTGAAQTVGYTVSVTFN